jgi:hypothetical protein
MTIKTIHGFDFSFSGEGFSHNEADFSTIVRRIVSRLNEMDTAAIERLHDGYINEDQAAIDKLQEIADAEALTVIRDWFDPNAPVYVWVAAT